jgi:short subunit dehydrogenase-like uncharacterized protein
MVTKTRPFDILVLGATGFTGRQLVHALQRQVEGRGLRIGLAGRRPEALAALQSGLAILPADAADEASLAKLARSGRVLLNLAGPYAERGEAVVAACVANGCHHLDLSGEVFWMRRMLQRHHAAAQAKGVLLVPACGYEALPFDLATQAIAHYLLLRHGERCAKVDIAIRLTGPAMTRLSDAVSGGTLASMRAVLEHDQTNSLQRMDCLLPEDLPAGWNANAVALTNTAPLSPWWDADWSSVMAPALPAPFINPPLVLRSAALAPEVFAPGFRYREGLQMRDSVEKLLGPLARVLPSNPWVQASLGGTSRAAQWSGAATLAAPLAALSAAAGQGGSMSRQALQRLIELVGPKPGEGPRPEALDAMGYELQIRAEGEAGTVQRALLRAKGHPGYRSTPEMMAAIGLGLAEGRIGAGKAGLLSPGAAFGVEALPLLETAGVRWTLEKE